MPDTVTFQLGPLTVRIRGKHLVTTWAAKMFESARSEAQPNVTFTFSNSPLASESSGSVRFHLPRFDLAVRAGLEADLFLRPQSSIWLDWRTWLGLGNSVELEQIEEFTVDAMPFLVQCGLLNSGHSLTHAAAMAVGDEALLVAAGSRVGKTSVLLPAVFKGKAKFLADDLAIIDQNGVVKLNPMPMQIYGKNLENNPQLAKFDSLPRRVGRLVYRAKAAQWLRPLDVFGAEKIVPSARLAEVILLLHSSRDRFDFRTVTPDEAAGLCGAMIVDDLPGFTERLADGGTILPTATAACDAIRKIFDSAFAGRRCGIVTVPPQENADELVRFARRHSPMLDTALG